MNQQPLRYRISDWRQATECLSNNSRDLRIDIAQYIQNQSIKGLVVRVVHTMFGVLFAAMPYSSGIIVSDTDNEGHFIPCMSTQDILVQLARFGFDIEYTIKTCLKGDQLDYLMQLDRMGFDKVSKIVLPSDVSNTRVVAFDSSKIDDWLTFGKRVSPAKYSSYLAHGSAIDITIPSIENDFMWDWLQSTMNITDILDDNTTEEIDVTPLPPGQFVPIVEDPAEEDAEEEV